MERKNCEHLFAVKYFIPFLCRGPEVVVCTQVVRRVVYTVDTPVGAGATDVHVQGLTHV